MGKRSTSGEVNNSPAKRMKPEVEAELQHEVPEYFGDIVDNTSVFYPTFITGKQGRSFAVFRKFGMRLQVCSNKL